VVDKKTCVIWSRGLADVIRPAGIQLVKLHDPADVIAQGAVLWDVYRKFCELIKGRAVFRPCLFSV
jgi:hypothetical protein